MMETVDPEGQDRLSRLSQASLRINESLDLDTVLQEVVDGARALTGSRYGVITTLDGSGRPLDFVTSGLTDEERRGLEDFLPEGLLVYQYLSALENRCGLPITRPMWGPWASPNSARCPSVRSWRPRSGTWGRAWAPSPWPGRNPAGSSAGRTRRPW